MKKRLLSLLLTLVMVLGMIPATTLTAFAAAGGEVYVGGVCMGDGDYLADGGTQTTKPSGGYAYYKDGVLTLHNYTVREGYVYESGLNGWDVPFSFEACIYSEDPLIIQLEGENIISSVGSEYMLDYIYRRWGILCYSDLVIRGTGSLNMSSDCFTIDADSTTIESGTLNVKARYYDVMDDWECNPIYNLYVNGGNVNIDSDHKAVSFISINGGNVFICSGEKAVGKILNIAEGLKVQASTTRDGALGEYVAANHDSYKKIVVYPDPDVYVVGDVNKDGLVNAKDALLLRKSIAAGIASSLDLKVADVNGDGVINAKDVVKLRRTVTGGYN